MVQHLLNSWQPITFPTYCLPFLFQDALGDLDDLFGDGGARAPSLDDFLGNHPDISDLFSDLADELNNILAEVQGLNLSQICTLPENEVYWKFRTFNQIWNLEEVDIIYGEGGVG